MSTTYLIAFNKDNALTKTKYYYKHILENKEKITDENAGVFFQDDLWPQEQEIADTLFPQRKVYAIRSSLYLGYCLSDKKFDNGHYICKEGYYICKKEQLVWFINFLKKHTRRGEDILFWQVNLGHPINYSKVSTVRMDVNDIVLPEDEFDFDWHIYQFVNTKGE